MYPYRLGLRGRQACLPFDFSGGLILQDGYYTIVDDDLRREIPLRWNELADKRVGWDGIDDGSWVAGIARAPSVEGHYHIYWSYPLSGRIHCWAVSPDGFREEGHDLALQQSLEFLSWPQHAKGFVAARKLAIAVEAGDFEAIGSWLAGAIDGELDGSLESDYLVATLPKHFADSPNNGGLSSSADAAMARLKHSVPHIVVSDYKNPRCFNARFGALFDLCKAAENGSETTARLSLPVTYARSAAELPGELPVGMPAFVHDESRLKSDKIGQSEEILYSFPRERNPKLTIHVEGTLPAERRVNYCIGYLNMLFSTYWPPHYELEAGAGSHRQYGLMLTHDTPPDIAGCVGFQRRKGHRGISLIPDEHFFLTLSYERTRRFVRNHPLSWASRKKAVFWRGATTGGLGLGHEEAVRLPRVQLCLRSKKLGSKADCAVTDIVQMGDEAEQQRVADYLIGAGIFGARVPQTDMAHYRFLIDIDGNANAWSLLEKMLYGVCIVKVESEWEQWYYPDLRPWVHYVPVARDLSDYEAIVDWCLANDQEAAEIAFRGQVFAHRLTFDQEMKRAGMAVATARPKLPALGQEC